MSQNHFNYMSQVPVKIAESYKPPKKVTLNQNIVQRLSNTSNAAVQCLANGTNEFSLERSVLAQMTQWQTARQRYEDEHKKRLCAYQQLRQKQFEENQKQMITAVSYPSTDDLSSDDDGDSGHGTSSDSKPPSATKIPIASATGQQQHFQLSPPNRFDSILMPTVMAARRGSENGNVSKAKTPLHSKFNLHEFENDSSNPFDNVELKSINDLDMLAEVWSSSVSLGKPQVDSTASQSSDPETPTAIEANPQPNELQTNLPTSDHFNANQMYHTPTVNNMHSELRQTTPSNHSSTTITQIAPKQLNDYYSNQMNFNYQPSVGVTNAVLGATFASGQPIHATPINNNDPYGNVQNQYVNTRYRPMLSEAAVRGVVGSISTEVTDSTYNNEPVIATQSKSRSRSVPDIVKEINGGTPQSSHARRVRNNSQCMHIQSLRQLN